MSAIKQYAKMIREVCDTLSFTMAEVGARPLGDEVEPAHILLELFPNSKTIAFEVNEQECIEMNKQAKPGLTYYPVALGKKKEQRDLYETVHPMCTSLYEPNEELLDYYNGLDVSYLKEKHSIQTEALDAFLKKHDIKNIDFIKIDVQGAELDVFKGARKALKSTLLIVSEVEFIPLYKDQPLFGDVSAYLAARKIMFHKFTGLSGRALKPIIIGNDPYSAVQHMWTDAVFIRDIRTYDQLDPEQLLKLSTLAFVYGSIDLSLHCLKLFDVRENTDLFNQYLTGSINR